MTSPVNPRASDPYQDFKVRLIYDGRYVYGGDCVYCGGHVPGLATFSIGRRAGSAADPSTSRSKYPALTLERGVSYDPSFYNWAKQGSDLVRSKYPALTLERGVTSDPSFSNWANQVKNSEVPPTNSRRDIYVVLLDEQGRSIITWRFVRCWVSSYKSLPNLGAASNAVAIEHIHLENEGFLVAAAHKGSH